MSSRSTVAALAALAATGCWPVIPGKADDYILPDTALVTGTFNMTTPVGGYWETTTPSGSAFWGVFAEPRAVTGVEYWGVPDTCVRNSTTGTDLLGAFRTGGSGTARLLRDDIEVRLTWDEEAKVFFGGLDAADYVPFVTYDLAPVDFGDLGTFEIPEFVATTESSFIVTSHPQMADAEMPVVSGPEALAFTWESDPQDYVGITVIAFSSSNQVLEDVSCVVDDKGSYTVPPELFEMVDSTAYVIVVIGTINLEGGTAIIGGVEQGYVTSSAFSVQGALAYGTVAP